MFGSSDNEGRPRVSVVMPVHNSGRSNLESSIGSVIAQTLRQVELVCVDDASTDCSKEILDEFAARDQRIRVIHFPENKGTLEARTAAVVASIGDYIVPLDPDDSLDLDACRRLCLAMDENGWTMAQFGMNLLCKGAGLDAKRREGLERWFDPGTGPDCSFATFAHDAFALNSRSWTMIAKVFRRKELASALQAVPHGYCVSYEDGLALLAFLVASDGRVGRVSDKLYNYTWGQGISTATAFSESRVRNMIVSAIFVARFLDSHRSQYADAFARLLFQNTISDIVYRIRPGNLRRKGLEWLAEGVARPVLERAFADLRISCALFSRCGLALKLLLARRPDRRRRLRRRLALVSRILFLRRLLRRLGNRTTHMERSQP